MGIKLKEAAYTVSKEEKQQAFLLKLSDAIWPLDNPADIEEAVTKIAMDFLNADRCYYCTKEEGNAIILRDASRGNLPSIAGVYPISSYPMFKAALDGGCPFIVEDVHTSDIIDEDLKQLCLQLQLVSFINVPVIKNGKSMGVLSLLQSKPRKWTDFEVQLTIETAERTWAAVERAKVLESLRKSEKKYRTLFDSIDQGFVFCELVRNKEGKGIDYFMLDVNPTYEKQTGLSIEMVLGKTILQVFPEFDKWWIATYAAVVDDQRPAKFEKYFEISQRWFEIKAYPGEKDKFVVLFSDITERKHTEEKIKESEHRYHEMIFSSPSMMAILKGEDMIIEIANDAIITSWGKGKDIIGKPISLILPEIIEQGFDKLLFNVYKTGKPYNAYETPVTILRNGISEIIYYNFIYQAQRNIYGFIEGVAILANEVTAQALLNKKIKESEQRYYALFMQSPFAFSIMKGKDMKVTLANDLMKEFWGKGNNVEEKTLLEILPELSNQPFPAMIDSVYTTGVPVYANEMLAQLNHNGILKDKYFNIVYEPHFEADNTISGVIIIAHEVTQQVLTRKNIEESETLFKLALFLTAKTVFKQDTQLKYTWIQNTHPSFEMIDLIGKTDIDLFSNDAAEILTTIKQTVLNTGITFIGDIQIEIDGKPSDFALMVEATKDVAGKITGIIAVTDDITEKKQAENKLKASEEKFKRLVLQAPVAICVLRGADYVIETMNEGMCAIWDRTEAQALNKPIFDVLPELRGQGIKELLDNVYFTGERCIVEELSVEIMLNGRLENAFVKFVYESLLEDDETVSGVMVLAYEITEQVVARKKVEESENKFEAAILAVEGIIWTKNANGEMMGEQLGWANLTGQSFEEYQGYGWAKAVHLDDAQPTLEAWNKAVATNSTFEFEHRVKTKQNVWRLFSVKAIPVLDKNGLIQQWVGVHTDVTENKLAQEKLAYRTALLEAHNEASIDGLLLVDTKGKILSFNQRFVEIWNMPKHIVNDKDDDAAISFMMNQLVNPQQFTVKVSDFCDHPSESSLDELEFKDGKVVERNGYAVIGLDGTYYAWSWTFKDITERKKIVQDLKNTKEQLELTFKNIPAGVYLINAKGEMVYVNDRGAAVYGDFTPEYMLEHKNMLTMLKIADELFERFNENGKYFSAQDSPAFISLTTGKPSQAILRQINKATKEQRWYYIQGAPLFDEEGNVSLVLITSTDITEQKNVEEKIKYSEERFRSLAQTLPQLVWVTDAKGNVEFTSLRWLEYTGIEPTTEKDWATIVHPDDLENINAVWANCLATGSNCNCDVRLKSIDGEYRWHTVIGEPVLDDENQILKWVGAFTETHSEKLFTQDLELKVKQRTMELEQFNIELENKNKELESFAYISSHDLQEPLRKIQTFASRIIDTEQKSLSEQGKNNFKRMQDAANRMQTLIQDLLVFSKTNSSERNFVKTKLNFIIDEVREDLSEEIKEKKATIEATELCDLKIIPFQFRQLMQNLIGNALKFSVKNQPPQIKIKSEKALGIDLDNSNLKPQIEYCRITVSDNGIGFEQHYSEKIFEVFQRLHGKTEYQGTGIGLAIVKKIVENHEGIITANSELNKGTTFTIYIPVR